MADTVTVNLKLKLPRLGKKPWKREWDFNFTLLDQKVGGILDGSIAAKRAETIDPTALVPYIQSVSGTLSGVIVPSEEVREVRMDHSSTMVFDLPLNPIFVVPINVNIVLLGDRASLSASEYGGIFIVRIENHSNSSVDGATINWTRKGIKL